MYAETFGCMYADFGCMSMERLGAKYVEVGCMYMETFGCMYADFGCIFMERLGACMRMSGAKYAVVGCKVCGCWVQGMRLLGASLWCVPDGRLLA